MSRHVLQAGSAGLLLAWGLTLCLTLGLILPAGAKPILKIEATPRSVKLGQSLKVQLTLIQEANSNGAMVDERYLELPELPGFETLALGKSNSTVMNNSSMRQMTQALFQLRPLKTGDLTIPSLSLRYTENGSQQTIKTDAITIHVGSQAASGPGGTLIWLGVGIAACAAGIWALRRQAGKAPQNEVAAPAMTKKRADGIEGFEARLAAGEDPQILLEELYEWFRGLAQRRGWAPHAGATHQEILATLRYESGLPGDKLEAIGQFLQACDQMRFAAHEVAPERFRRLLTLARQFC